MEHAINAVNILVNKREASQKLGEEVRAYLQERGVETATIDASTGDLSALRSDADLLISLGGDGTLLFGARLIAHTGMSILGVNLGEFGFIAEISREEWREALEGALAGTAEVSKRIMLRAEVRRSHEECDSAVCVGLNDVVVSSTHGARIIRLRVKVTASALGRYRADGVIVATPTGSTAYCMSAGGPIIHPEMDCFVVNPICPFTLSNRPIVVPGEEHIEISVEDEQRSQVDLTVDGRPVCRLLPGDVVSIRRADRPARILRSARRDYYQVLRAKLHWSGEPNA